MNHTALILLMIALITLTSCKGGKEEAQGQTSAPSQPDAGAIATTPEPTATPNPTAVPLPADVVTAGGVTVQFIDPGTGPVLMPGDRLTVHYTGWLESGEKFDSSHDWGQPLEFRLGRGEVIKGWDEGFARLRVGSRAKLIIPADLAYGRRGMPPRIPPDAPLVFEVEVLDAQ